MFSQKKLDQKLLIVFLIILGLSLIIPTLKLKYSITILIITILFFSLLFLKNIWIVIVLLLFLGPLFPYAYCFLKFTEPHFGGAPPYFSLTPFIIAFFSSILLFFIFKREHFKELIKIDKIVVIWIIFGFYAFFLSIFTAKNHAASFHEFIRMVIAAITCLIVYTLVNSEDRLKKILIIIGIILILESLIGFLQLYKILPLDLIKGEQIITGEIDFIGQIFRRPGGTLREPNTLAKLLSIYIPIFFILTLISREKKLRLFSLLTLLITTTGLLLTLGRSAIVGTFLGCMISFLMIALFSKEFLPPKEYIISGLSIVLISVIFIVIFFLKTLFLRFIVFGTLTLEGRLAQYQNAFFIIKNHFLTGIGLNNYCIIMIMEDISGTAALSPQFVVHNLYLLYLAETGIIGFLLFLSFIFAIINRIIKCLKKSTSNTILLAYLSGGMGGLFSILFQSLTGWGVRTETLFSFFFVIGLIISVSRLIHAKNE